ncbi:hypothetical protein thsps117_34420 [Pseudomonas sp. No.117]
MTIGFRASDTGPNGSADRLAKVSLANLSDTLQPGTVSGSRRDFLTLAGVPAGAVPTAQHRPDDELLVPGMLPATVIDFGIAVIADEGRQRDGPVAPPASLNLRVTVEFERKDPLANRDKAAQLARTALVHRGCVLPN